MAAPWFMGLRAMTATPIPTVPPPATTCPRCKTELTASSAAGGHCPRCLLAMALRDTPARAAGNLPTLAELAPLFPAYELQTLLGRGGMGVVYRARHLKLDRLVAIKLLLPDLERDPAFAERFEREARALARLGHPGIVGIHDFGTAGGFYFLVMEFVDGANLRELLAQGRLGAKDALLFVPQLCDALQYAHDHRIVHRDIKPENILVDQDGRVRIADFGLAKLLGQEPASLGLTQTHQAVGTPHYMAPEQVATAGSVDHRADLYSLGVVLYEMLTGNLPIGRFQPPSARAVDAKGLDPVVMKSLESDPAQRYQQAREMKTELTAAGAAPAQPEAEPRTAPLPPPPPVPVEPAKPPATTTQPPWGSLLTFAVVLAASFMSWGTAWGSEGSFLGDMRMPMPVTLWNSTILNIPSWLCLVLATIVTALTVARALGARIPKGSVFTTSSLGALLSGLLLAIAAGSDRLDAGPGLVLTILCFIAWNGMELRAISTAGARQHRLARAVRRHRRHAH